MVFPVVERVVVVIRVIGAAENQASLASASRVSTASHSRLNLAPLASHLRLNSSHFFSLETRSLHYSELMDGVVSGGAKGRVVSSVKLAFIEEFYCLGRINGA